MAIPQIEPGAHKTILLVNSDSEFLNQLANPLKNDGFGVLLATNGQTGSILFETYGDQIVLVVLDILLQQKDGLALLKEIKGNKNYQNVPVMIVSNMDDQKTIQDVKNMGVSAYIVRSKTNMTNIMTAIRDVLGIRVNK